LHPVDFFDGWKTDQQEYFDALPYERVANRPKGIYRRQTQILYLYLELRAKSLSPKIMHFEWSASKYSFWSQKMITTFDCATSSSSSK
jgi:hypothetical protein